MKLFVPERFSEEKVKIMRALGAEVTRTPDAEGMQGAIRQAKELVASDSTAFMAGQFENPGNPDYHYETTAHEIFEQMEGRVDAVVIGCGTSRNFFWSRALFERKVAAVCWRTRSKRRDRFSAADRRDRTKWKALERALSPRLSIARSATKS